MEIFVWVYGRIRYSTVCARYSDFLDRVQLMTQKLLKQGYVALRLKASLQKFYRRHHNLADHYEIFISQMTMDILLLRTFFSFLYRYQDFCRTWLYIDIRVKTMFGSSLPPNVLGGLLSYLRYLCVFAHNGVQHILCCICFVFLVYPMFPVSLDCPFSTI